MCQASFIRFIEKFENLERENIIDVPIQHLKLFFETKIIIIIQKNSNGVDRWQFNREEKMPHSLSHCNQKQRVLI